MPFNVQVTDKSLMEFLRRKVRLNQPYAGVFLKKDDEYANHDSISTVYINK